MMSARLALANLRHNFVRTALSLAGVAFAVVLMFMELGFLGAVQHTAVMIYDRLDFDLVIRSPDYLHLADARSIPRGRLLECASLPGVADARPFHATLGTWLTLSKDGSPREDSEWLGILVLGVQSDKSGLELPGLSRQLRKLTTDDSLLVDIESRSNYGPANGREFGPDDFGAVVDLSGRRFRIRGVFQLGSGLAANGAVLLDERGFRQVATYDAGKHVTMGLIQVSDGRRAAEIQQQLNAWYADRRRFPDGPPVAVLTRGEVERLETHHWVWETPIGIIFVMGVAIAVLVGAAIVYMVLSNDVEANLGEYATLHAMGYTKRFLAQVVLWLALFLALTAFLPSVAAAIGLYALTEQFANVPIRMTPERLVLVFVLTVVMCVVSGLLAVRKLQQADPADLF